MIILIHGPAELLRAEHLARLRAGISDDPALADLNTVVLDGRQASLADMQFACGALPFLAERRLVIVERLLARLVAPGKGRSKGGSATTEPGAGNETGEAAQPQTAGLLALLDGLPETIDLALVEEDVVTGGPVLRRLAELQREGRAAILACQKPRRNELPGWIRERARLREVQLDTGAIADLAEYVGDELRQIDQELLKLRDHAGSGHTITQADVRELVAATRAANVFEMVDALALGHSGQAGRLLRHAIDVDGEEPLGLLALFGRRYRQLIQVKSLLAAGVRGDEVARQLGVADWQARRLAEQAGRQSHERLQQALEAVLAADEAIKTGKCSDREALDILLAQLSQA